METIESTAPDAAHSFPIASSPSPFSFPTQTNTVVDPLNSARKKHEDRAKRFGVEYVEPKLEVVKVGAPKRYMNPRPSGLVTGFSLDDAAEKQKRDARARKFGAIESSSNNNNDTETNNDNNDNNNNNNNNTTNDGDGGPPAVPATGGDDMMDSGMDVDIREERKDVSVNVQRRLDAIYLYGTDNMSTEDIFQYFQDYGAACVEWINDSSCNAIFLDVHTATRALQGMSKPLDEFNLQVTTDSGLISVTTNPTTPTPTPGDPTNLPDATTLNDPNTTQTPTTVTGTATTTTVQATPEQIALYGWRKGKSVKGVPILMRYATVEDVKSKEFKPSAYYKRVLAQLRAEKKTKKQRNRQRGGRNRDNDRDRRDNGRDRDSRRNRNRNHHNRDDEGNGNGSGKGKRKKLDGDIDMMMADPVEQEKRLQRRKKFFPDEAASSEIPSNYIISSTTVPALLQQGSVFSSSSSSSSSTSQPPSQESVPEGINDHLNA